jgi:hypothetical protein
MSKNFFLLFFFISSTEVFEIINVFLTKVKGKIYLFQKSSLSFLTKELSISVENPSDMFHLRGIASHKCILLRVPIKPSNFGHLSSLMNRSNGLHLLFVLYNGLYLKSLVYKLIAVRNLPCLNTIILVIFICLKIVLKRLLSRFLLLKLKRLS